jgi:hypothetical protein
METLKTQPDKLEQLKYQYELLEGQRKRMLKIFLYAPEDVQQSIIKQLSEMLNLSIHVIEITENNYQNYLAMEADIPEESIVVVRGYEHVILNSRARKILAGHDLFQGLPNIRGVFVLTASEDTPYPTVRNMFSCGQLSDWVYDFWVSEASPAAD